MKAPHMFNILLIPRRVNIIFSKFLLKLFSNSYFYCSNIIYYFLKRSLNNNKVFWDVVDLTTFQNSYNLFLQWISMFFFIWQHIKLKPLYFWMKNTHKQYELQNELNCLSYLTKTYQNSYTYIFYNEFKCFPHPKTLLRSSFTRILLGRISKKKFFCVVKPIGFVIWICGFRMLIVFSPTLPIFAVGME